MKLFPKRKPYRKGYFPVSNGHELYFALYGNPSGTPVLFVHGGPGGSCRDGYRSFDPKKFNIILVDQRGAGKSRPFARLRGNTTQKLVMDFRNILKFLKIKKTFLFGGSWGSCLSLCYAMKYPKTVMGMVLRGIYLGSSFETDYMLTGVPKTHFPDVYQRFVSLVPKGRNILNYYWKMMNSKNKKTALKFCREWALYETSLCKLNYKAKEALKEVRGRWVIAIARIEGHYFRKNCFLPNNYILRNAHKLNNIPCSLVQGRYDFVCSPEAAYRLHKALPKSKLFFVTAGHASSDPEIREKMMKEIHEMRKKHGR